MGQISLKTTESGGLWPSSDGRFSVIHSNFASKSNKSWRFQPRLRIRRRCHKSILYDSKASWQLDYDVDYSATERAGRTRVGAFDRARRGLFDHRREIWRRGSRDPRRHPKLPPACQIFVKSDIILEIRQIEKRLTIYRSRRPKCQNKKITSRVPPKVTQGQKSILHSKIAKSKGD